MPSLFTFPQKMGKSQDVNASWDTFRKGLNLLLRPTELGRDELSQADNVMLIGSGVPTGRWGSVTYFTANATGSIRGFGTYNNTASGTNELIALTDQGYLVKRNGTGSTTLTGNSYPSGSQVRAEQLGGYTYFVSKDSPLTRYRGTNLEVFATILPPFGSSATNFSGASGSFTWSWKVTAISDNGNETNTLNNITLGSLPQDLNTTTVHFRWSGPSAATLSGYNIYRGLPGDETFLAFVGPTTFLYEDGGDPASDVIFPPTSNQTGGVKSKFIVKYQDRLLMVNKDDPTKLMISGRYPNQSRFNWADGGGYIYIDPDSGQDITAIGVRQSAGTTGGEIIVFKENSSYIVSLSTVSIGNFVVLDPQYQIVSSSIGCSSQDSVQSVENDIFYFGRKGMYVIGYEPNFLSLIRTNEVSARIRPYLALLSDNDFTTCNAMYVNNKYLLSFPSRKEIMTYDRERGAFMGPWSTPYGINKMILYRDSSGSEKWTLGSAENNQVYTFDTSTDSDNGTTIVKTVKTNKEEFKNWAELKSFEWFYVLLRSVTGTVTVNVLYEDRSGNLTTAKSFPVTGASISGKTGWGANLWGNALWGDTQGTVTTGTDEFTRWGKLDVDGRLVQVEVTTSEAASNFELLKIQQSARSLGRNSLPMASKV